MSETRPLIERHAVRALLVSPDEQLLLMHFRAPRPGWEIWLTPGGGREPAEAVEACLRREVYEETGLHGFARGAHVWCREHTFTWGERRIHQREDYFLVRVEPFEPDDTNLDEGEEREAFLGYRWWSLADILRSNERFVPRALGPGLRSLLEAGPPPTAIDINV